MDYKEEDHHNRFRVLMFPWLAHGHISPFLELAIKLTQRNFYIYFCSTPINLSSIKQQLTHHHETTTILFNPSLIQLIDLHLPSLPNLPPHYHTTKSLPPHLMSTLKKALDLSTPSFSNLLSTINPDLLIYDFIQPWAPTAASRLNIPAIQFLSTGAAFFSFFLHLLENPAVKFPFPSIYLTDYEERRVSQIMSYSDGLKDRDRLIQSINRSSNIVLIKTFREIEGNYIDYLSSSVGKEFVPVGPLVHEPPDFDNQMKKFSEWLVKKEKSSVVFVSFGSEYFMSKEEVEEIAYGLELSKVNFIWVIRFPEEEDNMRKISLHEVLPEGFMERVGVKGMVVEGWAPQAKILVNCKIGGFVSHCGWSSVMESMKFGVPVIAMPMHLDQPLNARLVVELGLGVEVQRGGDGGCRFEREEVAKVIKEVVMEKEGEEVRRRAREISEKMREKGEEEIDVLVEKLEQLCKKKKEHYLV
ncbi:UDP-glucuronosyl/UDP-glucosyltransferase [Macleaya cordata]|uniref:Glycosyltransferase n=1 Tax=Macleaya cordata TaxID=56857 RepID=A0A200PZH9_MACCD|nr:UDP-glucuronosyl/UDP-glucosyltransferase [Macleaya cordata]